MLRHATLRYIICLLPCFYVCLLPRRRRYAASSLIAVYHYDAAPRLIGALHDDEVPRCHIAASAAAYQRL